MREQMKMKLEENINTLEIKLQKSSEVHEFHTKQENINKKLNKQMQEKMMSEIKKMTD